MHAYPKSLTSSLPPALVYEIFSGASNREEREGGMKRGGWREKEEREERELKKDKERHTQRGD